MTDQELIERVAKEVMGWIKVKMTDHGFHWVNEKHEWIDEYYWNPLEEIEHMDMVLERMRERGLYLDVGAHINHTEWWAVFTGDTIGEANGTDITAMFRAILLAALDAVAHG